MRNQYIDVKTGAVCLLSRYRDGRRIDRIWVPEAHRQKGAGNRLLKHVLLAADAEQITLRLIICADDDSDMDNLALQRWYRSLGFDNDDGALYTYKRLPKCADIPDSMLRLNQMVAFTSNARRAKRVDLVRTLMLYL